MVKTVFDTFKASDELETAGIPREQAQAILIAIRKSHESINIDTKTDMSEIKNNISDIKKDISNFFYKNSTQMQSRLEQLEKRLDFSEKNYDRLEIKFDRLQWISIAVVLGFLFKEIIIRSFGY